MDGSYNGWNPDSIHFSGQLGVYDGGLQESSGGPDVFIHRNYGIRRRVPVVGIIGLVHYTDVHGVSESSYNYDGESQDTERILLFTGTDECRTSTYTEYFAHPIFHYLLELLYGTHKRRNLFIIRSLNRFRNCECIVHKRWREYHR